MNFDYDFINDDDDLDDGNVEFLIFSKILTSNIRVYMRASMAVRFVCPKTGSSCRYQGVADFRRKFLLSNRYRFTLHSLD